MNAKSEALSETISDLSVAELMSAFSSFLPQSVSALCNTSDQGFEQVLPRFLGFIEDGEPCEPYVGALLYVSEEATIRADRLQTKTLNLLDASLRRVASSVRMKAQTSQTWSGLAHEVLTVQERIASFVRERE